MNGLQPKTADRRAVALAAFRQLPDGPGPPIHRSTFPANPHQGCEHMIRMARAVGFVTDSAHRAYAALDVLNANGDLIQTFGIPTTIAFQWWKRKLHWQVESTDGDNAQNS
jgi:hypothetical protein